MSLANLQLLRDVLVITMEQLTLEAPPFPHGQHFHIVAISSFMENVLILVYSQSVT